MKRIPAPIFIFASMAFFFIRGAVFAAPVAYNDYSSFMADLPGPANILDFDDLAYGDPIADGQTLGGITFSYEFGGVTMMVVDDLYAPTTSSPNLLGANDGEVFLDGDNFTISFSPVRAVGMYFLSPDEMYDDDIVLSAGGGAASLNANMALFLGVDADNLPWHAYFLGIIDPDASFVSADVATIGGGYFVYNVDDIVTAAVPLPGALPLLVSGLAGLAWLRRKFAGKP